MPNPPFAATCAAENVTSMNDTALEMEQQQVVRERNELDSNLSGIIEINLGGQSAIQVHYETLCLVPESAFARIFTTNPDNQSSPSSWKKLGVSRDNKGRIFFDHDPTLMESIINYLRLKRTHMLAAESSPPPLPPPKPPKGKEEEFDILLHCFGLNPVFYPTNGNEINSDRAQQQNQSDHREETASERNRSQRNQATNNRTSSGHQVPNIICISEEERKLPNNIEESTNNCSNSTNDDIDDDEDDDAKTCPLSLDSSDDVIESQEMNVKETSVKRPRQFEGNDGSSKKKTRKNSPKESSTSTNNQKDHSNSTSPIDVSNNDDSGPVKSNSIQTNSYQLIKKMGKRQVKLHLYLSKCQRENKSQSIANEAAWTFLPGKPVDACTHCPACGKTFQTKLDKLEYRPCEENQSDLDQIRRHARLEKCNSWKAYYSPRRPRYSVYEDEADYVFHRLSTWVLSGLDCVKLTVKDFSREVAIERMRNRFAVGRYRITILRWRASHEYLFDQSSESGYCKIRHLAKHRFSAKLLRVILKKCELILDQLEKRCMSILYHKNFSTKVTSKKMITTVINDLNLITVSKVHAYRLLDEYETQCGIIRTTTPVKQRVEVRSSAKCDQKRKSSKSTRRTAAASMNDSDSDDDLLNSSVQRLLFRTQSSSNRSKATTIDSATKIPPRSSSNEKSRGVTEESPKKARRITIDLLSSDSETENDFKSSDRPRKKTPLAELQKIVTRLKRSNSATSPGSRKR